MNVLNIISTTLTKQHSTYFQPRRAESRSPRSLSLAVNQINARQFNSMNLSILIDEIRANLDKPDWPVVVRLSNSLFNSVDAGGNGSSSMLFAALALKEWLLVHGNAEDIKNKRQDILTLARGHLEIWLMKGVAAEMYHLRRANELYAIYFRDYPTSVHVRDQVDHCKVLHFLGEGQAAADIITSVVANNQSDPQIANYSFYAGVIYKSLGIYDRANDYFFEATDNGPPRYFSQIEMMTIISRNLEEMNAEGEGEDNEDAYRMIHTHLLMEGLIPSEMDYEDWIGDANTWLALGDKCAMHHMFSLATDFYGLGIMKDHDAFRKPMLWLRFAKACKRCGRKADALLAVKQALSKAPHNAQLNRAFNYCTESETFHFSDIVAGELSKVLDLIPPQEGNGDVVVSKLQAIAKGALVRTGLLLGVGTQKVNTRPMTARLGLVLQGRPVLLKVQASWMGKVTHIKVFDVLSGVASKAPLRTPFAPARETGAPRRLVLTMALAPVFSHSASQCLDADHAHEHPPSCVELILKFTDRDTGVYSYRWMRLKLLNKPEEMNKKTKHTGRDEVIPPHSLESWGSMSSRPLDIQVENLNMLEHKSLLDLQSQPSLYRTLLRESSLLDNAPPRGMLSSLPESQITSTVTFASVATPVLAVQAEASGAGHLEDTSKNAFGDGSLQFNPDQYSSLGGYDEVLDVAAAVSVTNALTVELVKEGFRWRDRYYLVRVVNEHDVTQVTFMQLHTDRIFVFLMAREHIDRSFSLSKRWAYLMQILENNPATAVLLDNSAPPNVLITENFSLAVGPSELFSNAGDVEVEESVGGPQRVPNPLQLSDSELRRAAGALDKPQTIMGKYVYTSLLPRGNGVSVILVDPHNQPIIGSGLEVVDAMADAPASLSVLRDSVSHKFRDGPSTEVGIDIDHGEGGDLEDFSQLEYGSAVQPEASGMGMSESGKHHLSGASGEGSAYELLGSAAALPVSDGDSFAMSPEEYEAMVRSHSRNMLSLKTDSDMEGLRYGGALDDDSVSQVLLGSPEGHFPFFDNVSPKANATSPTMPFAEDELTSAEVPADQGQDHSEDNEAIPSGQTMQNDAMAAFEDTLEYIAKIAEHDGTEALQGFALPAPAAAALVRAPSVDRLVAARKSISLGMNLGAALSASLTAGKSKTVIAAGIPRRHSSAQLTAVARHSLRKSSVGKFGVGSPAYSALVSVKAAAVVLSSVAIGTALAAASVGVTAVFPPPLLITRTSRVDSILGAIREVEEESQQSEDDWIAQLFRESFAAEEEGSETVDLEKLAAEIDSGALVPLNVASEGVEYTEEVPTPHSRPIRSRTRTGSDMYSEVSSDDEYGGPVPLDQDDIEWIVELGSDGAMEKFEEKLLEEVFNQVVTQMSEIYSDQIPGIRDPLVDSVLADAVDSVTEFVLYSEELCAQELEKVVQVEAVSVALLQVVEAHAVKNAIRAIRAAEKAKVMAARKAIHDERVRIAAAKAAEIEAKAAADFAELKRFPTTVVGESSAEVSMRNGYFVKKIRSHIYGTEESEQPPVLVLSKSGLLDGGPSAISTRPHTVGSRRMSALRDTFTPELPQSLMSPHQQAGRPYTHHQQVTATHGGVVQHFPEPLAPREPSALIARAQEDETRDVILDESGVPLHIGDRSYDDSCQAWEGNDMSLNNYFQLEDSQQLVSPVKTRIGSPGRIASAPLQRSAGEVSQHNRQVMQSRRSQNRGKPVEGIAPMWLTLGGAESASLLLPGAESSAVLDYTGGLGSTSLLSTGAGMNTTGVPLPLPMRKDEFQVPIVSSLHSRAQSPAMPAAALPNYAYSSADGLKQALQQNWDGRTIPKYWNTALKVRADERINEPFSVKSATARRQRRAIKAKAAFAAAAAASAVNSSAQTREEVDMQFTSLMEDNEHVHESFFESHVGPFGSVDVPFVNYLRRSDSQQGRIDWNSSSQVLSQQQSQSLARPSTAPAADARIPPSLASYGLVGANSYVTKVHQPSYSTKSQTQQRATTAGSSRIENPPSVVEVPTDTSLPNTTPATQNPAHPTRKFYKGLHHDHEYDTSHLLANQIEPPFHHISTRIACRSPPDVALHFKRSTAAIAEEIDDAVEREEVDEVFRKSLETFHKIGYVQKLPLPHATHWVKVIAKYLMSLKSINELRKRLAILQRAAPRSLTTEECICVLADVNGVAGQAVEKLKHLEYYAEIRLVSRSIHVKNMVHLLEGGEDVYKFKVGEGRPRTASQEEFATSWTASDSAFAQRHMVPSRAPTTPGGAMFAGMDEDMLRAATLVVDPYDTSMVAQHPEVVAHRKIREQYDELTASFASTAADGLPPRAQSAKLGFSEKSIGFQGMQSTKSQRSTCSSQQGSQTGFGSSSERISPEKEIASLGKFLPPVQQLNLTHSSPYVRSRASLVVLSGNNDTPTVKEEEGEETQSHDASIEELVAPRGNSRSSLRMSVSSPHKASAGIAGGNESTPVGGRSRSSLRLSVSSPKKRPTGSVRLGSMNANSFMLGAIAAAVAAVEEQEEGGEAVMAALSPSARTPSRRRTAGGSLSAAGVGAGSFRADSNTTRNSLKVSAAQQQRAWRQKSGIFDAAAFSAAISEANSATSSRDGSPTNTRRSPKHTASPKFNPSPRNSSPTGKSSRTPTFRKVNTQSVSFDFHDYGSSNDGTARDQNQEEEPDIVLREDDEAAAAEEEEEEEEEGEEGNELDATPTGDLFFDNVRPSKHISMNPWYLKNQKQQAPVVKVATHAAMPTASSLLPSPIETEARPASQLPPPRLIPVLIKQRSYRAETIVGDLFEQEAVGVPFAVMSRRDASRAAQDEVLARSSKNHIRRSVELRAANFHHTEKI